MGIDLQRLQHYMCSTDMLALKQDVPTGGWGAGGGGGGGGGGGVGPLHDIRELQINLPRSMYTNVGDGRERCSSNAYVFVVSTNCSAINYMYYETCIFIFTAWLHCHLNSICHPTFSHYVHM